MLSSIQSRPTNMPTAEITGLRVITRVSAIHVVEVPLRRTSPYFLTKKLYCANIQAYSILPQFAPVDPRKVFQSLLNDRKGRQTHNRTTPLYLWYSKWHFYLQCLYREYNVRIYLSGVKRLFLRYQVRACFAKADSIFLICRSVVNGIQR